MVERPSIKNVEQSLKQNPRFSSNIDEKETHVIPRVKQYASLIEWIRDMGVAVRSVTEPYDSGDVPTLSTQARL